MNYIQQINWFEQWAEINMPSTGQYALYYALLALNNRSGWKEWFKVANVSVTDRIGMTPQGVRKARSYLIERGLIEIQMVGSNKATLYRIVPLTNEIVSANYSTSGIVTATVSAEDDLPLEKFPQQFPVLKPKQDPKQETKTSSQNVYQIYQNSIGPMSGTILQMLDDDITTYGEETVSEAIKEAARQGKNKLSYVEGILKRWKTDGRESKIAEFRTSSQRRVGEYDKLSL